VFGRRDLEAEFDNVDSIYQDSANLRAMQDQEPAGASGSVAVVRRLGDRAMATIWAAIISDLPAKQAGWRLAMQNKRIVKFLSNWINVNIKKTSYQLDSDVSTMQMRFFTDAIGSGIPVDKVNSRWGEAEEKIRQAVEARKASPMPLQPDICR
jgi:hypothetical protein